MSHLVLIGDSTLDNVAYTQGGPDVIAHVRALLPHGWDATLLAVDGSTTDQVSTQLGRLPSDATHLVLSIGGNNALMQMPVLQRPVLSIAQAMEALADVATDFETEYRAALAACLDADLPVVVCTIYNGYFDDRPFQRIASATLTLFNDAIIRVASEHALPMIDLRAVCAQPEDYANQIEPSAVGGEKIARVIVSLVATTQTAAPAARIVVS